MLMVDALHTTSMRRWPSIHSKPLASVAVLHGGHGVLTKMCLMFINPMIVQTHGSLMHDCSTKTLGKVLALIATTASSKTRHGTFNVLANVLATTGLMSMNNRTSPPAASAPCPQPPSPAHSSAKQWLGSGLVVNHFPRHVFVQDYLVHGWNDQMTFKRYKGPNDREVSWNPALGENWKNNWILETFPCFNPPALLMKERKTSQH